MNTPIVEGDQLEIDFNLDRLRFSICPSCASQVINLANGCGVCGWSEEDKLLGGEENLLEQKEKRSSPSKDLSIPCTIKQPKQPEVKGIIQKDLGDRFIVYIPDSDSIITVSKLFVYPDFSKSVGQIDKNPSKTFSPSKNIQRKTRRRKGEGNGYIYYRTVTRNGFDYQQAYYHWVEGGKKRSLYIPKKLLDRVCEAERRKLPVNDILILLGEKQINPSKSSVTSSDEQDKINGEAIDTCEINPSKIESKSKSQRRRGEGSGSIYWRTIKKNGKDYQQTYYHYEIWSKGDRLVKSCEYIPLKMRSQIQKMNDEKVPVEEILRVLRRRKKR